MKGGWPFGFGTSDTCDKNLFIKIKNDIIRMKNNNVDDNLKINIATYIRSKGCNKFVIDENNKKYPEYVYHNGIYVSSKNTNDNNLYYIGNDSNLKPMSDNAIKLYLKYIKYNTLDENYIDNNKIIKNNALCLSTQDSNTDISVQPDLTTIKNFCNSSDVYNELNNNVHNTWRTAGAAK